MFSNFKIKKIWLFQSVPTVREHLVENFGKAAMESQRELDHSAIPLLCDAITKEDLMEKSGCATEEAVCNNGACFSPKINFQLQASVKYH